jgi:hypothetical protein
MHKKVKGQSSAVLNTLSRYQDYVGVDVKLNASLTSTLN